MESLKKEKSIDSYVGNNLRVIRKKRDLSQESVAQMVGVTFQQIQKYERGLNRISCGKLWRFAEIFQVPISYFFRGIQAIRDEYSFPEEANDNYAVHDAGGTEHMCSLALNAQIFEYLERIESVKIKVGILNFVKTLYEDTD